MTEFIQLHLLTAYPPANLNRDDMGRPKTAIVGGTQRLRISSQSLKRAYRTSAVFEESLKGFIGTRTKRKGVQVYESLLEKGVPQKDALKWAKEIAGVFGKLKTPGENDPPTAGLEIAQLAHFGPEEMQAIDDLVDKLADARRGPTKEEKELLRKDLRAVDIALFGRMLAESSQFNKEAAAQVSHAFTVHKVAVEDDYFSAVDDLNVRGETGAGHIGHAEFASGLFYLYICIDRDLLEENLTGDKELTKKALKALAEAAAKVAPTGKQASFASRAYASFILAERGDQQPRSLMAAYLKALEGRGIELAEARDALIQKRARFDAVYGKCWREECRVDAIDGTGKFQDLLDFVSK